MAGKVLSIEIGQTTTRIVEMTHNVTNPKVFWAVSLDTPPDIVTDGTIQVTEQFVGMIRECLKAKHNSTKKAVFVMNSGRIANREIVLPSVKDSRIKGLLQANATDYFPIELDQYQLVHEILERFTEDGAKKLRLSVLAIPKDIISSYETLARMCGLEMEGMTYIGSVVSQMMAREIKGEIKACLHMNEDMAILTVMENEKVLLQRTVNYGIFDSMTVVADSGMAGQNATMAVVRNFMQRNACVRINEYGEDDDFSLEAAKAAVRGEDIPKPNEDGEQKDSALMNEMQESVMDSLRNMIGSVGRILDYYQSRNAEKKIDRLYMTGFAATCRDFAQMLGNELEFRVLTLDRFSKIHLNNASEDSGLLVEHFAGIGAGISSSLDVAVESKAGKKQAAGDSGSMAIPIFIFGVCLIASVALASYSILTNLALKAENLVLNEQVEEMSYIADVEATYEGAKKDYEWAKQIDAATRSNNDNLRSFFEELEEKMPSDIHLLTLTATQTSVNLNIEVGSKKSAAAVVSQLRKFNSITVGTVSTITDTQEETGGRKVSFSVDCIYVQTPGADAGQEGTDAAEPDAGGGDSAAADASGDADSKDGSAGEASGDANATDAQESEQATQS